MLIWLSQKGSPCILLFKPSLELIPCLFLLPFHPSWLNQAIILKGNFRLFVTSPLRSPPPPHHATFREEKAKPLDQSNLFLTHFHSQGLPLQEEGDRNKSNTLALGTWGRHSRRAWMAAGMGLRSLGACFQMLGTLGKSTNLKSNAWSNVWQ